MGAQAGSSCWQGSVWKRMASSSFATGQKPHQSPPANNCVHEYDCTTPQTAAVKRLSVWHCTPDDVDGDDDDDNNDKDLYKQGPYDASGKYRKKK